MSEINDWNQSIVEEFRANAGKVGGQFAGAPMLLLTTTGAKSGLRRTNPLVYRAEGHRMYVFASYAGAPASPDWYHNLVAHPDVSVEVGTETFEATAAPVTGDERDRIYAEQAKVFPAFVGYQQKTKRTIPVVEIKRKP